MEDGICQYAWQSGGFTYQSSPHGRQTEGICPDAPASYLWLCRSSGLNIICGACRSSLTIWIALPVKRKRLRSTTSAKCLNWSRNMFEKYYLIKLITIFLQVLWINGILPQNIYDDIRIIKQGDSIFQCRTSYLFLFFNIYIQTSLILTQFWLEGSILDLWICNWSNRIPIIRSKGVTDIIFLV